MLSKGSYDIPNQWTDLTICNIIPTKGRHPWEQSVGPFKDLVTFFSETGELVADPFVGTGTSGVAAVELGRRFVGTDVDAAAVKLGVERLRKQGSANSARLSASAPAPSSAADHPAPPLA